MNIDRFIMMFVLLCMVLMLISTNIKFAQYNLHNSKKIDSLQVQINELSRIDSAMIRHFDYRLNNLGGLK